MKTAVLTLTLGALLTVFTISMGDFTSCNTTNRVGRGMVYAEGTFSSCNKDTHIVGRGIVPKLPVQEVSNVRM